jgi:hypothetical protein
MSAQMTLKQHSLTLNQFGQSRDPLQNRKAAVNAFNRARNRGAWRALLARLTRRSTQLQHYGSKNQSAVRLASRGIETVALDEVIGSEGRSRDFDAQFWPLKEHNRDRWVNIAVAMASGKPLPPVELIQTPGGYVVRDGHHRLSVARAFGRAVIEAAIV